jgi:hypothetical protein
MKKTVASKFKFPKVFGFYLKLLEAMHKGQELPYRQLSSSYLGLIAHLWGSGSFILLLSSVCTFFLW